jgi:hypothetical protein
MVLNISSFYANESLKKKDGKAYSVSQVDKLTTAVYSYVGHTDNPIWLKT